MDNTTYLQAVKIRLYPNEEQRNYISRLVGSCRYVYNSCLDYKIKKYNNEKKSVSLAELGKFLTELKQKEDSKWLSEVHSKVLQQSLINLDLAYKSFFKNGAGFPKFKSKRSSKQSCRFPIDAIGDTNGNRITIIKQLKNIHFKCSTRDEIRLNKFKDNIKSGTLTVSKSGNYYFSILIELPTDLKKEVPPTISKIGLDVGINNFIVDSNGTRYENLKLIRLNEKKLKKLQRQISRKLKSSNNRGKAILKLTKFHQKLSNLKDYYLHEISNKLINENQVIAIEDLNVSGMMKNKYLSKSIQELSLFRFKEMLTYKSNWYNRTLIQVDRFYPSSKICSCCGSKNNSLTLNDRSWKCVKCNTNHDRDFNAAKNILMEANRILGLSSPEVTLGEIDTGRSMNQEKNVFQ